MSGSFESMQWNACVHRLIWKSFREWSQGREKSPLPEALRRVEPTMLHHAEQWAQHTLPTELFWPLFPILNCISHFAHPSYSSAFPAMLDISVQWVRGSPLSAAVSQSVPKASCGPCLASQSSFAHPNSQLTSTVSGKSGGHFSGDFFLRLPPPFAPTFSPYPSRFVFLFILLFNIF